MRGSGIRRQLLLDLLAERLGAAPQTVVDLGGGTGGLAAMLAAAGHHVTVIDPRPDALAAVEQRAAEAGLGERLVARQGDSSTITADLAPASVDLLLCHEVLEYVDDPAAALVGIAEVLGHGAALSLVEGQRFARAMAHASADDFAAAGRVLDDPDVLGPQQCAQFAAAAGLEVQALQGLELASSQVSERVAEGRGAEMLELERRLAAEPNLLAAAPRWHLLATRP